MKDIQILGVDLGKNSCSVVGLDPAGRVLLRCRMPREGEVALAAKLPGCARWRHAAERIIWGACWSPRATKCG